VSPSRAFALAAAALVLGTVLPPAPRPALAAVTPTIDSVFPKTGQITTGGSVTITGTNFFHPMSVTFDGLPATNVVVANMSTTVLTCSAPAHPAGTVDVVVAPASEPLNSATLPAAFTYLASPPSYVWVPRGPGMAGGGPDVSIVDYANRRETATLDLNALLAASPYAALPGFPPLPTDDQWCVTQVLFAGSGDVAFLATAGEPGTANSGAVFVVSAPRAIGDEAGAVLLAALPAVNPYQLALSSSGVTLFAADGGNWAAEPTSLENVNGRVLSWNLEDLALLLAGGVPTELPVPKSRTVGPLPVLSYDRPSTYGWGTNSSSRGTIFSYRGVFFNGTVGEPDYEVVFTGDIAPVTSALGNSVWDLSLPNLGNSFERPVGFGGLSDLTTTAIPSPFDAGLLFVETFQRGADPAMAQYFRHTVDSDEDDPGRVVARPVRLFEAPDPDLHDLQALRRLHVRTAWPYPGARALVALPEARPKVASWDAASGEALLSPAGSDLPGGIPTSLAYNDATGFFYAREGDTGWTVLKVPDPPLVDPDDCPNGTEPPRVDAPALEAVASIDDTEGGVDSLRVVGNGSFLVATGTSKLVIIEGRKTALPADIHRISGLPIALGLDPAGGPVFPQPGTTGGTSRSFPVAPGNSSLKVTGPIGADPFELATLAAPPGFTGISPDPTFATNMMELGSQYDFLPVPGSIRVRVPFAGTAFTPSTAVWRRLLRAVAAGGNAERPLYARLIVGGPRGESSAESPTVCFHLAATKDPVLTAPGINTPLPAATPPKFEFDAMQEGTAWVRITVRPTGKPERVVARIRVDGDPAEALPTPLGELTPRARTWARIVRAVKRAAGTGVKEAFWTLEVKDALGRNVPAPDAIRFTIVP